MSDPKIIKNISFLGKTFNYVKLDPFNLENAATTKNVFDLDLDSANTTVDKEWILPAGTTYKPRTGGTYEYSRLDESNFSSISSRFEATSKVTVSVPFVATTKASTTSKQTSKSITETKNTLIFSEYRIPLHELELTTYPASLAPKIDDYFKERVKSLKTLIRLDKAPWSYETYINNVNLAKDMGINIPVTFSKQDWEKNIENNMVKYNPSAFDDICLFLRDFGSHFARRIVLGGVMYNRTTISEKDMQFFETKDIDVEMEAQGTFKSVTGSAGGSVSSGSSEEYRDTVGEQCEKTSFIGGNPNIFDPQEWQASLHDEPSVITVWLSPIYELFTPEFFPDDEHISVKQEMMKYLIEGDSLPEKWPEGQEIGGQDTWIPDNVYAFMNRDWDNDPIDFKRCYHKVHLNKLASLKIETDVSKLHSINQSDRYKVDKL